MGKWIRKSKDRPEGVTVEILFAGKQNQGTLHAYQSTTRLAEGDKLTFTLDNCVTTIIDNETYVAIPVVFDTPSAGCGCPRCVTDGSHWSDCAVHGTDTGDETAFPPDGISYEGPCDCAGTRMSEAQINRWRNYSDAELDAALQAVWVSGYKAR